MQKIYSYIFLGILCADFFGASLGGLTHQLSHFLVDAEHDLFYQNMSPEEAHEHLVFHAHGDGYHTHGSALALLLNTFQLEEQDAPSRDGRTLIFLYWTLHGLVPSYERPQESLVSRVSGPTMHIARRLHIPDLDIPTPPPRLVTGLLRSWGSSEYSAVSS